ncbi:MAG: hypothetical protein M3P83_05180 [Actinomycetota bacterium]|nr:hypothetical protein [Actinomycetota bacterium]
MTRRPLPTWDQALDAVDDDDAAKPAHIIRFGRQLDLQGIIAEEEDADRRVAYLTKYLTKSFADTYSGEEGLSPRQVRHLERLHAETQFLPCSPRCWNWLRYGVQPLRADDGMRPGQCPAKAHGRDHLGCGGRRVLVSRQWSGKTLSEHRADRAAVVRQVLAAAGMQAPEIDRLAASVQRPDGLPRYEWKIWNPLQSSVPIYRQVVTTAITQRIRWKADYETAKVRASPPGLPLDNRGFVLPIASHLRSAGWLSRVSEANREATRSALDGQPGDQTIKRRGG